MLNGITCPSDSFCAVDDNAGNVFTSSDPASGGWTANDFGYPSNVPPDDGSLVSLACPSSSLCLGRSGVWALASTSPSGGSTSDDASWLTSGSDPTGVDALGADVWTTSDLYSGADAGPITCAPTAVCVTGSMSVSGGNQAQGVVTAGVAAMQVPVASDPPIISGVDEDGRTLATTDGTWAGGTPTAYAYQWEDCDGSGGACQAINGATSSTYSLQDSDLGKTVKVVVTASNFAGSPSGEESPPT